MEILNIGPLELIIILVLMFILLGPKEMVLTAHRIGMWVRSFLRSPMWREIWGISQDIRELPKKIVSESGLDETMAELKKTTQEATDEINKELKDVAEAARVPEAEHMRIEPNAVPASSSISNAGKDFADKISAKLNVADSAETADSGAESGEEPAVLAVADVEPPAAPKRRGRPRKAAPAEEEQPAATEAPASVEETPAAPRRRGRPKKTVETAAEAPVEAEQEVPVKQEASAEQKAPAEQRVPAAQEAPASETLAPGLRRIPVLAGVAPRVVAPKATQPAEVVEPKTSAGPESPAAEQPAAVVPVVDAPEPAAQAPLAATPKRPGRPKKEPAVVQVADEPPAEAVTPSRRDNGAASSPASAEAEGHAPEEAAVTPVRKPRKPRATTQRQGNGTAAEEGADPKPTD